ncbi:MAG: hypothetical protein Fur0014_11400 [Rubrivivax sp.]
MTAPADREGGLRHFVIRDEAPGDEAAMDLVTRAAFHDHPFSRQTEHRIVRSLREAGALRLSRVATIDGDVVGHIAFPGVTNAGVDLGWWGLGPVSVAPAHRRAGVGSALVRSGLRRLGERGVPGCFVLGDPAYYRRFGFAPHPGLTLPGPPPDHFMAIALQGSVPHGQVAYHPASEVAPWRVLHAAGLRYGSAVTAGGAHAGGAARRRPAETTDRSRKGHSEELDPRRGRSASSGPRPAQRSLGVHDAFAMRAVGPALPRPAGRRDSRGASRQDGPFRLLC